MRKTIIITDGEQRSALAIVRSLGAAGHTVHVCSSREKCLAGASRYARTVHTVASALLHPEAFVDDIAAIVRRTNADILIPPTEPAALALLAQENRFRDVALPFPRNDSFHRLCDKALVLDTARSLGISVPAQLRVDSPACISEADFEALRYPVVLKPGRSVSGDATQRQKYAVRYAESRVVLERQLNDLPLTAYPILVQEKIHGPGVGVFLLLWEGETIAAFSHQRLREKPPSGGVCVYGVSRAMSQAMLAHSRQLLDAFDWSGVAMVEYKLDARTGTPYLMEVNPRFWGSLQLAIDSGVDFPRLLVDGLCGSPLSPVHNYKIGVRIRWSWGEVDHVIAQWRSRNGSDAESSWRSRWKSLALLSPWQPGVRNEVFRLRDPAPYLRETINWFQELA